MRFFLLVIFYFLTSCTAICSNLIGHFPDNKIFLERFPNNKKAIIISRFHDNSMMAESAMWCRVIDDSDLKKVDFCVNFLFANKAEIIMLEPGKYYLFSTSNKKYRSKKYLYEMEEKFLSVNRSKLSFTVRAAEIAYIGDMYKKSGRVDFEDEFLELKKLLQNRNYEALEKTFVNKKTDLTWLIERRNMIVKKIPHSNIKSVKKGHTALEKHGLKVINSGDDKDLAELSKSLKMLNNLIEAKKTENALEDIAE